MHTLINTLAVPFGRVSCPHDVTECYTCNRRHAVRLQQQYTLQQIYDTVYEVPNSNLTLQGVAPHLPDLVLSHTPSASPDRPSRTHTFTFPEKYSAPKILSASVNENCSATPNSNEVSSSNSDSYTNCSSSCSSSSCSSSSCSSSSCSSSSIIYNQSPNTRNAHIVQNENNLNDRERQCSQSLGYITFFDEDSQEENDFDDALKSFQEGTENVYEPDDQMPHSSSFDSSAEIDSLIISNFVHPRVTDNVPSNSVTFSPNYVRSRRLTGAPSGFDDARSSSRDATDNSNTDSSINYCLTSNNNMQHRLVNPKTTSTFRSYHHEDQSCMKINEQVHHIKNVKNKMLTDHCDYFDCLAKSQEQEFTGHKDTRSVGAQNSQFLDARLLTDSLKHRKTWVLPPSPPAPPPATDDECYVVATTYRERVRAQPSEAIIAAAAELQQISDNFQLEHGLARDEISALVAHVTAVLPDPAVALGACAVASVVAVLSWQLGALLWYKLS